ncbi:MAG: sulfite exporter TauE/SafE family protein [Pseudomonadales bacterium]|nr:sulfite exporter TauE/SafE family protein [Pseudomonadales bacterium]MCP5184297.1 sulfite exporter TauE/SafE family protein [Pseudomonadales bacterium]
MNTAGIVLFLVSALAGSYLQAVTGFAMGLLMVAVMGASGWLPLPLVAAAVSFLALVNIALSLRGRFHFRDRQLLRWLLIGQVCAVGPGVWLLHELDANAQRALALLLGSFITAGALSMLARPHRRAALSGRAGALVAGASGGMLAGLFAASGPVLGWFMYRQPLPLDGIRATLLTFFAVSSTLRIAAVGISGGLTVEVGWLVVGALPLVLLGSWLGRRFPPAASEAGIQRLAFSVLLLAGAWILVGAFR